MSGAFPRLSRMAVPPFRAWRLNPRANWPWGVQDATGVNVFEHRDGGVFASSRAEAEALIRANGHEPMEVLNDER